MLGRLMGRMRGDRNGKRGPTLANNRLVLFGALLLAMAFGAPAAALAACEGDEFDISQYGDDIFRPYIMLVVATTENYYQVSFNQTCMSPTENGAFVRQDTLVLGIPFIERMGALSFNHITAVIAHETGHRFQVANGVLTSNIINGRVKCIELLADYMAGDFLRVWSRGADIDPNKMAELFYGLGDDYIHDFDHHGLGEERLVAFAQGYSEVHANVKESWAQGMKYVANADCGAS